MDTNGQPTVIASGKIKLKDYAHSPVHYAICTNDNLALRQILQKLGKPPPAGSITTEEASLQAELRADEISAILDRRDVPGKESPLFLAVRCRNVSAVELLMEHGAEVSLQNSRGWTPLQEAVCLRDEEIVTIILRRHQVLAWAKYMRRLPALQAIMRKMRDFYMEITWNFESSVIPFISRIAPSDTYCIWKRGACLRADMTLAGFDGLRIKRKEQSLLFFGDGKPSCIASGFKGLKAGTIAMLNHEKREVFDALEGAGGEPSSADLAQDLKSLFMTNVYRAGIDVSKATLTKQFTWRGQPRTEQVGGYRTVLHELHPVELKLKSRKVPGALNDAELFMGSRGNECEATASGVGDTLEDVMTPEERLQFEAALNENKMEECVVDGSIKGRGGVRQEWGQEHQEDPWELAGAVEGLDISLHSVSMNDKDPDQGGCLQDDSRVSATCTGNSYDVAKGYSWMEESSAADSLGARASAGAPVDSRALGEQDGSDDRRAGLGGTEQHSIQPGISGECQGDLDNSPNKKGWFKSRRYNSSRSLKAGELPVLNQREIATRGQNGSRSQRTDSFQLSHGSLGEGVQEAAPCTDEKFEKKRNQAKGRVEHEDEEKEYHQGLKPLLWLTDDFPLDLQELLPLLDLLANKVKAVKRLRELLTTKLPPGTVPVKVAIPIVPTIRVSVTYSKFEELPKAAELSESNADSDGDEFHTPPGSPERDTLENVLLSPSSSNTSWFGWVRNRKSGKRGGKHESEDSEDGASNPASEANRWALDPFEIPAEYSWLDAAERKRRRKRSQKHRERERDKTDEASQRKEGKADQSRQAPEAKWSEKTAG